LFFIAPINNNSEKTKLKKVEVPKIPKIDSNRMRAKKRIAIIMLTTDRMRKNLAFSAMPQNFTAITPKKILYIELVKIQVKVHTNTPYLDKIATNIRVMIGNTGKTICSIPAILINILPGACVEVVSAFTKITNNARDRAKNNARLIEAKGVKGIASVISHTAVNNAAISTALQIIAIVVIICRALDLHIFRA
jgi:hypothetical protein